MTKKFISLLIAVIMVVGLLPSMGISASAEPTILFEDDFENYSTKSFNDGYTVTSNNFYMKNSDGTTKFTVGKFFKADIVEMQGYDSKMTNAFKLTMNHNITGYDSTSGQARLTLAGIYSKNNYDKRPASGTYIFEYKVFVPDAVDSGGTKIRQDLKSFQIAPVVKIDGGYHLGSSAVDSTKNGPEIGSFTLGQWHKFTYVQDVATGKTIVYLNDKCVAYDKYNVTSIGYLFQFSQRRGVENEHLIFDDFKLWYNPSVTTAYSTYFDNPEVPVPVNANPVVNFTEMLLDVPDASPASISKANVKMIESDGSADGKEIEIKSVTLGADKKSIVIDPTSTLDNETTYNVKVTGLRDIYDQLIPDYEFTFTTAGETSLAISAPEFTMVDFDNGTTKNAEKLENGFVNASYKVTNNASSVQKLVMFAVLKDGDTIESIQLKDVTIAAKATVNFNGGFKVEDAQNKKMEVYIWDDMRNMTPLAAKYAIDATSKTVVPN